MTRPVPPVSPRTSRRRVRRWAAVAVCLSLLAAGCADNADEADSGDGPGTTADRPAPEEVFGAEDPAEGEPVLLGYSSEAGSAISNDEDLQAAEATVEYVNTYLGGVAGRPIELSICTTESTPESGTSCGNQFVEEGVEAVLVGVSGSGGPIAGTVVPAGIPYVAFQAGAAQEITPPDLAYALGATVGVFAGVAAYARDEGVEELAVIVIDVPTAIAGLDVFGYQFEDAGVDVTTVGVPPGTADMTSQVTANADADMFFVLGDPTFCIAALQATESVAPDTPVVAVNQCIDPTVVEAAPDAVDGAVTVSSSNTIPEDNEEFELYNAVLDEFAPEDIPRQGLAINGYGAVLGFARLMEGLEGEVTSETINTQIRESRDQTLPLSAGEIEIACGDSPVEIAAASCTTGVFLTTLDGDGQPTDSQFFDDRDLLEQD